VRQQGWARAYQAWAQLLAGDATAALAASQEASRLLDQAGDRDGLPQALAWMGRSYEALGRTDDALQVHRKQLAVVTDPATAPGPAIAAGTALSARASIGKLHVSQGDWDAAVQALRPAVVLAEAVTIPPLQAQMLASLGEALCQTGHRGEGIERLRTAEALYQGLRSESDTARVQALLHKYARD
jgi:tetratricopeptide (TPR) repeat protein